MPMFDYKCRGCGHLFEVLVFGGQGVACPECASADVEKQLAMRFKVGTPALTPAQKEQRSMERAGYVKVNKPRR